MIKLLFFATQVFAAGSGTLVQFYPAEVLINEAVEFRPIDGHHFSIEAPQNCGSGSLNEKTPRTVKCQFAKAGETQATLNVCDDKKTFCKPVMLKVDVKAGTFAPSQTLRKNEHVNRELKKTLIAGFTEGTPQEIMTDAAQKNQPVFVMISTDWCPPCNESKEYLIPSEAFKTATKDWFKVYVDGDSMAAADWEKTVPYHYFPSYVLLNSKMQEIARYFGELRQGEFVVWAKVQSARLNDPIASVRERVLARLSGQLTRKILDLWHGIRPDEMNRDQERLLSWSLDQEDKALTAQLIGEGDYPNLRPQILHYQLDEIDRVGKLEKKDFKPEKIKIYETLLKETFTGEHWSTSLEGLCELEPVTCKPFLAKIPERMAFLEKHQGWNESERESAIGDEYYYITETYHALEDKAGLKEFGGKCAAHFEAMQKNTALKISRAGYQGMVACLELTGNFAAEEKALKALLAAYPNEPTFLWRMARMRNKQNKYDDSLAWIKKAEDLAYGYNWFSIELLKAEVQLKAKKPTEARQTIASTLAQIQLDPSTESRNQRLVARLRNLESNALGQ